jgi:hypothetical protein
MCLLLAAYLKCKNEELYLFDQYRNENSRVQAYKLLQFSIICTV